MKRLEEREREREMEVEERGEMSPEEQHMKAEAITVPVNYCRWTLLLTLISYLDTMYSTQPADF